MKQKRKVIKEFLNNTQSGCDAHIGKEMPDDVLSTNERTLSLNLNLNHDAKCIDITNSWYSYI